MKLFTCLTPSHAPLFDQHFLPSVEVSGLDLQPPFTLPEQNASEFGSEGFRRSCVEKIECVRHVLDQEEDPFVFSDVDVCFYGTVAEDLLSCLQNADIAFQWDGPAGLECTGFMVIRPSDVTRRLFAEVAENMSKLNLLDQPAMHEALRQNHVARHYPLVSRSTLPQRYWTFGRNNMHWVPGDIVNPPDTLLVHHANWTTGVANKLALLKAVKDAVAGGFVRYCPPKADHWDDAAPYSLNVPQDMLARSPLGVTAAAMQLVQQEVAKVKAPHHPMPLAVVLQFWEGDKRRACELARLLADIEPAFRDDVIFVFAAQEGTEMDKVLWETMLYVGQKFRFMELPTRIDPKKRYPGVCFDPWENAARRLAASYYEGAIPHHSAFFIEADGCPLAGDWIDQVKRAHAETLLLGKYVTGPHMRYGGHDHINGSLVMYLPFFINSPGLHSCPPDVAWDVFFGPLLVNNAGPSQVIRNEHGMQGVTENQWWILAKESAWLTSVKDGTPQHWARRALVVPK